MSFVGIGRDLAKQLVESGAETFALSRTLSDLQSLKKEVGSILVYAIISLTINGTLLPSTDPFPKIICHSSGLKKWKI